MKCYACETENLDMGMDYCPKCGFPLKHRVGGVENEKSLMQKRAEAYRKKQLDGISLGMMAYAHEIRDGHLEQSGIQEILLMKSIYGLSPGEILWKKHKFARIAGGERITVTLCITYNGERRQVDLPIVAPETGDFWQVGIWMEPGFEVKVAVGTPGNFNYSESTPLF